MLRDAGSTSYIIYADIILTTCVEYYTECIMSYRFGHHRKAKSSKKSFTPSHLYIIFISLFSRLGIKEREIPSKSRFTCTWITMCVCCEPSVLPSVIRRVVWVPKKQTFIYNRKLNVVFSTLPSYYSIKTSRCLYMCTCILIQLKLSFFPFYIIYSNRLRLRIKIYQALFAFVVQCYHTTLYNDLYIYTYTHSHEFISMCLRKRVNYQMVINYL